MRALPATLVALALACGLAARARADVTSPAGAASGVGASALNAQDRPAALRDVGFDQHLEKTVPLDLHFRDESGRLVRLGDYFGQKPVILSLVYFRCPMLCGLGLQGLARSLKPLELSAGKDFTILTVSFDPTDTPKTATEKRKDALQRYGRDGAAAGWHFLTGDPAAIKALTDAVGFRYAYDQQHDQYAHPAGIVMLTPDGHIARYFFGIDFSSRDLRLGLVESTQGKIGTVVDQVLLFCFHYDPANGRYSAMTLNVVRAGGVLTIVGLVAFIGGALWRESHRRSMRHGTGGS